MSERDGEGIGGAASLVRRGGSLCHRYSSAWQRGAGPGLGGVWRGLAGTGLQKGRAHFISTRGVARSGSALLCLCCGCDLTLDPPDATPSPAEGTLHSSPTPITLTLHRSPFTPHPSPFHSSLRPPLPH